MSKVNIAGILFDALKLDEAVEKLEEHIAGNRQLDECIIKKIQAANVDSVVKAHINEDMKRAANKFDMVLADGMPIVWASKLLRRDIPERAAGPDFFEKFNQKANDRGFSYYFLGSTEETVSKILARLNVEYPNIKIKGFYIPPLCSMRDKEISAKICEDINRLCPDVVWVSLGCPKQEVWINENGKDIRASAIMGIGAAFDFYGKTKKRAPRLMQKLGLEWFYRFLQEPGRLFRRYFIEGPRFIGYVVRYRNRVL